MKMLVAIHNTFVGIGVWNFFVFVLNAVFVMV